MASASDGEARGAWRPLETQIITASGRTLGAAQSSSDAMVKFIFTGEDDAALRANARALVDVAGATVEIAS